MADREQKRLEKRKEEKLAKEIMHATNLAANQYRAALTTIGHLKDTGYQKFRQQVERVAYNDGWHASILDGTAAVSAADRESTKFTLDNKKNGR